MESIKLSEAIMARIAASRKRSNDEISATVQIVIEQLGLQGVYTLDEKAGALIPQETKKE